MKVIEKWGSIYKLGVDVPVQDWKSKVQIVMKPTSHWHFKLQVPKRIIISKTETGYAVRGESFYKNDMGTNQSLLRRERKLDIKPSTVDIGMPLKSDKKKSISNLIAKPYGSNWRNDEALSFFKSAFDELPLPSTSTSRDGNEANTELFCLEETLDFDI
ncbi:unnamed protein product [Acanthoscelides obtectus]|uniref:Uncharacterized protein n=1 Tax=Acanthoscelides obtectus TaxID=200917 RepID=A0A9P0PIN3_ACAOB|nr:unnamed protein product [Acanthoscelides obtectus]CAK1677523.1 hypothetical protein AOBTE_LOCUS31378 [Acanthoscelides obtectus]